MATPAETRDQLIKDLRAANKKLTSPEWLGMIRDGTETQRQTAADNLMNVSLALLDLENEALASFRDKMMANEAAIAESTEAMKKALQRLESVAKVLTAVTSLIKVVGRFLALA
jgi:hypothetical protein